jgi:hypothetical protein
MRGACDTSFNAVLCVGGNDQPIKENSRRA